MAHTLVNKASTKICKRAQVSDFRFQTHGKKPLGRAAAYP
jgi:hypothetical protein